MCTFVCLVCVLYCVHFVCIRSMCDAGHVCVLTCPQVPESYLSLNWPINYACVDQDGRYLAVAGKAGVALFSSLNRKWKLFSNEQQEQSLVCRGGLSWWNDIVIFPCIVSCSNVEVREGRGRSHVCAFHFSVCQYHEEMMMLSYLLRFFSLSVLHSLACCCMLPC